MTRERWGTFSVADHKRRRAFVADVLLYDRLIIPVPPEYLERKEWVRLGWDPDRLYPLLRVLSDNVRYDHAIRVPWTQDKRELFKTRMQSGEEARNDSDQLALPPEKKDPMQLTRRLLSENFFPQLPDGVTKAWAMPAYPSYYEFNKELNIKVEDERERSQYLRCALAHRFLVPTSSDKSDLELLKDAVALADKDEFGEHRAAYYDLEEEFINEKIPIAKAVEEMEIHLKALNKIVKKAKNKVHWKFALTLIPIALILAGPVALALGGVASSPLTISLAGAGGLVSLFKFAKLERKPEYQAGKHAPAAMFHDSRKIM